jgi:hypothetical protein
MKQRFTKGLVALMVALMLLTSNTIVLAGMKDIELTPGKATNVGNMMKAFPTVADAQMTVHFFFETDGLVNLHVFDIQGRVVAADQGFVPQARTHECIVDVSGIAEGIYFAKLTHTNGTTLTSKFVVQH